MEQRRAYIDKAHPDLSIVAQCEMMSINRSGLYYTPCGETPLNLDVMRKIDEHFLKYPFKGVLRMTAWLRDSGYKVNPKRTRRLYHLMGLQTIYPKRNLSKADRKAYKYPYLLRGLKIDHSNQVWAIDITYIPMRKGFMYLCAIIDLHSRFVVGWSISNTMTTECVNEIVKHAIARHGKPEIINSDQGSQFTSKEYVELLQNAGIQISMDGKGRALDNIFIERLWRRVKYEDIYIKDYADGLELYEGLKMYFLEYNELHGHQSLDYKTPHQIYYKAAA